MKKELLKNANKDNEKKLVAPINEVDESMSESRMTLEPNAVLPQD